MKERKCFFTITCDNNSLRRFAMKVLPVIGNQKETKSFWYALQELGIQEEYDNLEKILIFGGDGTLLGSQRDYYKLGVPFIGVGFGSVNFLLNRNINNPADFYEKLMKDVWVNFLMQAIEVEILTKGGIKQKGIAFNDVYFKAVDPTSSVTLKLDTREYSNLKVKGDGLIIASPQGSTAYNRNAGGTILPLDSGLWCLTGICTQDRLHVTVAHQNIQVKVIRGDAMLVTDNKVFEQVQEVHIMPSNFKTAISFDRGENFEQRRYNSF